MSEKGFIDGLSAKAPSEKAPDFIKAGGSINLKSFAKYLRELKDKEPDVEWLNFQIKESKGGKWYIERDTWEPKKQEAPPAAQPSTGFEPNDDDIPF